jgi:hypothetical protein
MALPWCGISPDTQKGNNNRHPPSIIARLPE